MGAVCDIMGFMCAASGMQTAPNIWYRTS